LISYQVGCWTLWIDAVSPDTRGDTGQFRTEDNVPWEERLSQSSAAFCWQG
jgi:hypothetical protein